MPEPHVTPEQIVALRDEELRDWAVVRHLRICPECQARLRDARALQVLLSRPESQPAAHPKPEELAAYVEETLPRRDTRILVAHVAACPRCFADLEAIRAQRQPAPAAEDAPPDWVVAAAARSFQPPQSPLDLGKVVVEWLRRLGLALEYYPPTAEAGPRTLPMIAMMDSLSNATAGMAMDVCFEDVLCRTELSGVPPDHTVPPEPVEQEAGPVEVTVGDLRVRLAARGRSRDSVKLTIIITGQQNSTPVPGVRLALETDEETLRPTMTDAAGTAEFPLPPGPTTLTFLSPVHAELKILF
jgi:hypothetical protein